MGKPFSLAALAGGVIVAMTMTGWSANAATPTVTPLSGNTVTLITGDQVTMQGKQVAIHPATSDGSFESYQIGSGDHYVIPAVARPYLGRQLDPALFDVSALLRDGTAARTPVRLTFSTTPQAPPGVTITATQGNTATGYVSGTAFIAALRKQIGADIAAGHPAGTAPLFDGLTGISLDAAGAPLVAHPNFPLNILQINGIDATGQPAAFLPVILANTDSFAKSNNFVPVVDGIGRVAVPAGDYTAIGLDTEFDTNGNVTASRLVTVSDFVVAASGTSTVTVDERTATSQISVTTPRPAEQDLAVNKLLRTDPTGSTLEVDSGGGGSAPDLVTPQPPVKIGKQHFVVEWGGQPTVEPKDPYRYDVDFGSPDGSIPANESYTALPSQLATAHEHFSADPAEGSNQGQLLNGATDPTFAATGFFSATASSSFITAPGNITDYLGTADGGAWWQFAVEPAINAQADVRTFAPGRTYSIDWMHGPLGSGFGQHAGDLAFCTVCVSGDTAEIAFEQLSDSEPDHNGNTFDEAQNHFTLSANGTVLVDQDGFFGAFVTGIPTTPTTFRTTFDNDMTGLPGLSQSTESHTDMTIQYHPDTDPTLPATAFCARQTPTTPCTILPALNLSYRLATDETNTSHSPVQVLGLEVGHATIGGVGSRSPIKSASVQVSFDGGTTWVTANVLGANGSYVAAWRNKAAAPELKVTAADANGDTITQTITNAYTFAGQK